MTPTQAGTVDAGAPDSAGTVTAAVQSPASEAEQNPVKKRFSAFSSLRYRDYRFLWTGIVFMSAGQWIQQVTLGWLVYDMTGSSVLLGVLNGFRTLPFLFSGPIAGVAADRFDRRKLLISTQAILFVTAFVMGALVVTGRAEVWHLFVFTLITGIAWAFNQPIRQSLIPAVVPKPELMNAVALASFGFNFTKIIAPTLAGLMIALFTVSGNFFVQGLTYAGVLVMVFMMHTGGHVKDTRKSSAFSDLVEGLNYVRTNPVMLSLIGASLISQVVAMPYVALMPIFQKDVLHIGPEGLGILLAAPAIGAVAATFLLAQFAERIHHRGLIRLIALAMLGIFLVSFSQSGSLPLAILSLVGVGFSQMMFVNVSMTMVQMLVPDELRGRVISLYMLDRGLTPLGALFAGVCASFVGASLTVTLMGVMVIVLAVVVSVTVPMVNDSDLQPVETISAH